MNSSKSLQKHSRELYLIIIPDVCVKKYSICNILVNCTLLIFMTYGRQLIYRLDFLVPFTEMIHFVHYILKFNLYKNLLHSSVQNFFSHRNCHPYYIVYSSSAKIYVSDIGTKLSEISTGRSANIYVPDIGTNLSEIGTDVPQKYKCPI